MYYNNAMPPYGFWPVPPPYQPNVDTVDPIKQMKRWRKFQKMEEAERKKTEEEKKKNDKKPEKKGMSARDTAIIMTLLSPFIGLFMGYTFLYCLHQMIEYSHQVFK